MRIARLDLHAFGPFTNARLSFDRKPLAVQLVYGPNEAGKSSTLRALIALLYGIPVRTTDAHLHEMAKLRVGGVLLDETGREYRVVRRKGAKHTLLNREDKPLAEDLLVPLLGGLDEALFRQMFGLDHERLRQGAEALLAGGGHLGEGLFDAGTGARAIRLATEKLKREADELFKARGRAPKLNAAIEALRERQRAQREAALSPSAFLEQQRGLAEARSAQAAAVEKRRVLRAEKARLERAIRLIPLLARYDALVTAQPSDPAQAEVEEHWDSLLRELHERFMSMRNAVAEVPRDREALGLLEREIAVLKERVGSAGELVRALDTPLRARIRALVEEQRSLAREKDALSRSLLEQRSARETYARKLHDLSAEQEAAALVRALEQVDREGVEAALQSLELELAQGQASIERSAAQLGLALDVDALSRLSLPDDATLSALERTSLDLEGERQRLGAARRELAQRARKLEHERRQLLAEGELETLEHLARVRSARDHAYQALFQNVVPSDAGARHRYEALVREADALADRLRREAQRATELARVEANQHALAEEQAALEALEGALSTRSSTLESEVHKVLSPLGLSTERPQHWRKQVMKLGSLAEKAVAHCARGEVRARLTTRASELSERLAAALNCPLQGADPRARLAYASALARTRVEAHGRAQRERDILRTRIDELDAELAGAEQRALELEVALSSVRTRLAEQFGRLGLAPELSADEAMACLDELTELQRKTTEAEARRARIARITEEEQGLAADVRALSLRCAPHASEFGLPEALEALESVLKARREARRVQAERARELAKLSEQLRELGDGAPLDDLRAQAAGLPPDAARARVQELEDELDALEQEIASLNQAIGGKEAGLLLLERPSDAVALAEDVQGELSQVRMLSRRYLELQLALAVLTQEVERYRASHQGPVLSRASELFPRLTLGRYRGLDVEYDERDAEVLCCVRADGKAVRVAGLSDGTRDQLYLSLRVASIERFLENNAPLPLVLDDAFIHFDDQRAEAALSVLAELCAKTQVLFFTHHARMVELAKSALPRDRWMLHELDPARGVINVRDDGPLFADA